MASHNGWSPIQFKMLQILSDGQWHTYYELFNCLDDELAGDTTVPTHLSAIKKKLELRSEGIASIKFNGTLHYQHVRMVAGSDS